MTNSYPEWLHVSAWTYIFICAVSGTWMIFDLFRHRQKMWIMNLVWPTSAMYFGPVAWWLYLRTRALNRRSPAGDKDKTKLEKAPPTAEQISIAVFHCGAGCTLGDVIGEVGLFALGNSVLILGSEFATKIVVDFILAFVLGIVFQYYTITPMRGLGFRDGLVAAVRADTISIVAFQIGMFAWMAFTHFVLMSEIGPLKPNMAVFWFMMQIAMIVGWATSYPANRWLIKKGWKEKMPQYPSMTVRKQHELPRQAA